MKKRNLFVSQVQVKKLRRVWNDRPWKFDGFVFCFFDPSYRMEFAKLNFSVFAIVELLRV